ncbi:MAG: precorrin-6y C5,15-methyltransferase (decarboxylating) subunit CbiE [Actinobacteria bacterium]|nr:precorrin-6y C5,15-methyltransferase (decarboxylating) subunit CbiE [Actinomycetota bacterium]
MNRVSVVGVGANGAESLFPQALKIVNEAEIVFGGERILNMFPWLNAQKVVIGNNLSEVVGLIRNNLGYKQMVVLAAGDPNFYGVAKTLIAGLGKDVVEVTPNVSAMQLAFARIKESWDDAVLTSVHGRPIADIVEIVSSHHKIGIFTDDNNSPAEIARVLQEQGVENCQAYVCQDMGTTNESIISTDMYSLKEQEFSPLNTLILIRGPSVANHLSRLGISDQSFYQWQEGLITKMEVRAISLAKMRLTEKSIVWDIGAGSGAMTIEASLLADKGTIFAIEKNPDRAVIIRNNIRKFGRKNIRVIETMAPEGLGNLPDPDAIFVGGSGGRIAEILSKVSSSLKPCGRIVINIVTLENLHLAVEELRSNGFVFEIVLVNVARSKEISDLTRLEAMNPVFVLTGWKD